MTQGELDELVREHQTWFSTRSGQRLDLRGENLSGLSLAGYRIYECRLHDVDLSKANLCGAAFLRAELTHVRFLGAYGERVRFSDAKLMDCAFDGAQLSAAAFDGVYAVRCSFVGAVMAEANLVKANFTDVRMEQANLSAINGLRLHMQGGSMASALLVEADLRYAFFLGVDFRHADVTNSGLDAAHFKRTRVFGMVGRPAILEQLTAEAVDCSPLGNGDDQRTGNEFLAWLDSDR